MNWLNKMFTGKTPKGPCGAQPLPMASETRLIVSIRYSCAIPADIADTIRDRFVEELQEAIDDVEQPLLAVDDPRLAGSPVTCSVDIYGASLA